MDIVLLFIAALVAGFLNAIAGGGSFVTFPSLVFTGVPALSANATNAVSVFPGYVTTAWRFRNDISRFGGGNVVFFIGLSALGGALGALVLLYHPNSLVSGSPSLVGCFLRSCSLRLRIR